MVAWFLRLFHREAEVDNGNSAFWREAVDVAAAILREQGTGNFQKLLADGLAFAPSLEWADLQKTNLQFAYLGSREESGRFNRTTNLIHADFYRADLSGASLKGAKAHRAIFYQARMHNTVFTGADLSDANFFGADLKGAKFDEAYLNGANFKDARNIPVDIASKLDDNGVYQDIRQFCHHSPLLKASKYGCL